MEGVFLEQQQSKNIVSLLATTGLTKADFEEDKSLINSEQPVEKDQLECIFSEGLQQMENNNYPDYKQPNSYPNNQRQHQNMQAEVEQHQNEQMQAEQVNDPQKGRRSDDSDSSSPEEESIIQLKTIPKYQDIQTNLPRLMGVIIRSYLFTQYHYTIYRDQCIAMLFDLDNYLYSKETKKQANLSLKNFKLLVHSPIRREMAYNTIVKYGRKHILNMKNEPSRKLGFLRALKKFIFRIRNPDLLQRIFNKQEFT